MSGARGLARGFTNLQKISLANGMVDSIERVRVVVTASSYGRSPRIAPDTRSFSPKPGTSRSEPTDWQHHE